MFALAAEANTTKTTFVTTLYTKDNQVQIPDGLLTSGTTYVAQIFALNVAGDDVSTAPFVGGLPFLQTSVVTSKFTP